ncbi:MAG TPA: ABC transporter permease [Candidatus Acidoferrales bacterium]|nr:ABC transporter permease [Candidatus Acidoferrales bacterium]
MSVRNIGIVYRKELTDSLRDRRTLISTIVMPLLLIPAMTIGFGTFAVSMVKKAEKETPRVMILGGADSPETVAALKRIPGVQFVPAADDYASEISNKTLRAAVRLPEGFQASLPGSGDPAHVEIYIYESDLKSEIAGQKIRVFFDELRQKTVESRLAQRNLSPTLLRPFDVAKKNVAPQEKVGAALSSAMLPYLVILMCLTGAMYPAMDMTAGEKERGTMETILTSRVSRIDLVLGKFLLVLTASIATALLAVSSMGATSQFAAKMFASQLPPGSSGQFQLNFNAQALVAVFALVVPVGMLFSSALLAISLFAKTYKEAQSYISPLMIVVIVPAVASLMPGVELNWRLALVPILNTSLVSKEILSGTYHWQFIAAVFLSSCVYASAALATAVHLFQREDVLFRT